MTSMTHRKAGLDDAKILWEWANDPDTRKNSFSDHPIPWEEHKAWLGQKLSSKDSLLLIFFLKKEPVGQVRFDRRESEAVVDISVAPDFRRKGVGARILTAAVREAKLLWPGVSVVALAKNENQASKKLFSKSGFASKPASLEGVTRFEL